jgi:hypothetical protein
MRSQHETVFAGAKRNRVRASTDTEEDRFMNATSKSSVKASSVNFDSSIDDYLADYKHEMVSIHDFLSSLEEGPDLVNQERNSHHESASSERSLLRPSIRSIEDYTTSLTKADGAARSESDDSSDAFASLKRSGSCTSAEAREEQRRIKNREYQRRFRERRRILEYQRFARPRPLN